MKTIILNSGQGTRMGRLTDNKPKCMVQLNDKTILSRQLKQLKKYDLKDIIITTGPHEEDLIRYTEKISGDLDVRFVHNEKYGKTNYIYTLYLTKNLVEKENVILMHGDLCFEDRILDILLGKEEGSRGLINDVVSPPEKDFKAKIQNGFIKKISVDIDSKKSVLFQPFYFLENEDFENWMSSIKRFVDDGKTGLYAEDALNPLLKDGRVEIKSVKFTDGFCMEIDTTADLEKAKSFLNG